MIFIKKYKTGALFTIGLLFCLTQGGNSVQAQVSTNINRDVINRLKQVERQIQTISRSVFTGDDTKAVKFDIGGGSSASSVSGFEDRISQIEQDQRNIINKLERVNYELGMLQDKIELIQSDNTQRFGKHPQSISKFGSRSGLDTPVTNTEPKGTTFSLSAKERGNADSIYEKAFKSVKDMEYSKAEEGFIIFLEQYPNHPLSPNSQYWLGETYYVRGNYKQAAKAFAKGYQQFPDSAKAQDSLLKLSLSLAALGKKKDACLTLEQLKKEGESNPNHPIQKRVLIEMKKFSCN